MLNIIKQKKNDPVIPQSLTLCAPLEYVIKFLSTSAVQDLISLQC